MNPITAARDHVHDLIEAGLTSIAGLQCAARLETNDMDGENSRVEKGLVPVIEGTVDEDVTTIVADGAVHSIWAR
jgi:hypothetical protein